MPPRPAAKPAQLRSGSSSGGVSLRALLEPALYEQYGADAAALLAAAVVSLYAFTPLKATAEPWITVSHNTTDPDKLKPGQFMRFEAGPRDVPFYLFCCLVAVVIYDSIRELIPKKLFASASGLDVEARNAFRHLLAQAAFALLTVVFIMNMFVAITSTSEPLSTGDKSEPFGPFSRQGFGFFSEGAPHAYSLGTKVALLADSAFWLVCFLLQLYRATRKFKVSPYPAMIEAALHSAFSLVAYRFYFGHVALIALLVGGVGEVVDVLGLANSAYRAPPANAKDKEKFQKRDQGALGSLLEPLSKYGLLVRTVCAGVTVALASYVLFLALPKAVAARRSELSPAEAARDYTSPLYAVITLTLLVGRMVVPLIVRPQLTIRHAD